MAAKGCQTGRLHQSRSHETLLDNGSWAVGVALQPLSCFQTSCAKSSWIKDLFDHPAMHLGDEINSAAPCCIFLSAEPMSWKPIFLYGLNCENLSWWQSEQNNGRYPGTICLRKHWLQGQLEAVKTCRTSLHCSWFFFSSNFFFLLIFFPPNFFFPPQWQDVCKSCPFNQLFIRAYFRILATLSTGRSVKFSIKTP